MTVSTKSRHFCFCIPVRFGVFVLSFFALISSGLVAGIVWVALAKGPQNNVYIANNLKVGLIIAGVLYTIFALISLAGLVGALIRNRALVKTFAIFLWFQLFASMAYLIAFSIALFDKPLQNHLVSACIQQTNATVNAVNGNSTTSIVGETPQQIEDGCRSVFNMNKALFFVSFALFFLITLYCCIIVRRYGKQLTDEQAYLASANTENGTNQAAFQPSFYPHTPLSHVEPGYGAGPSNAYPFAQREHGFGSQSQNK